MKHQPYTVTLEEISLVKKLSEASFEFLDLVRSKLHSATIKKGYSQPQIVLDAMSKGIKYVNKDLEVNIKFLNIELPNNYTQDGYTVDIWFETTETIHLIDPKGIGHDNNTPISDEVTKWVLAKKQVQFLNPNKNVRFILLKPNDVDENEFRRLKKSYGEFGIELHKTDNFLTDFTNTKTSVCEILSQRKEFLMRQSLQNIISS